MLDYKRLMRMCDERIHALRSKKNMYAFYGITSTQDTESRIRQLARLKVNLEQRMYHELIYRALEVCDELGVDNTNDAFVDMYVQGYVDGIDC